MEVQFCCHIILLLIPCLVDDGVLMVGRGRPLLKVMDVLQHLIQMTSVDLLSQYPHTELTTLAFLVPVITRFWLSGKLVWLDETSAVESILGNELNVNV